MKLCFLKRSLYRVIFKIIFFKLFFLNLWKILEKSCGHHYSLQIIHYIRCIFYILSMQPPTTFSTYSHASGRNWTAAVVPFFAISTEESPITCYHLLGVFPAHPTILIGCEVCRDMDKTIYFQIWCLLVISKDVVK